MSLRDRSTAFQAAVFAAGLISAPLVTTMPGSDLYPVDEYHVRRLMLGGSLSRQAWGFTFGGTAFAVDYSHNGSGADATTHLAAFSGATRITVALPASARTPAQVATATAAALNAELAGDPATAIGADVSIAGGLLRVISAAVDTTDHSLAGMWGAQREDWGAGLVAQNSNGGTDSTTIQHIGQLSTDARIPAATTARILGTYFWGHTAHTPLMAAGIGPIFSADPGAITILDEGITDAASGNALVILLFAEPIEIDTDDELWIMSRGDTATAPGGPRFRNHALTPVGRGDTPLNQAIINDTTAAFANTDSFGSSYDPTADSNFNIYMAQGVLFERQDASGNYWADGAIDTWTGDQNEDDEHGTQFAAGPATIDSETTHHRFLVPQWYEALTVQVRRAYDAIDLVGDDREDNRICFYDFPDLDFPSAVAASLIGDAGLQLVDTENAYNTVTLAAAVDLGVDAIGANRTISLGWNYVTQDGTALGTQVLPVFLDVATGDGSWLNCWEDDREEWHDHIPGASGGGRAPTSGVIEYRTTNTTMPHDSWSQTWPDPFETDAGDDSPNALALEAYRTQRAGFLAA